VNSQGRRRCSRCLREHADRYRTARGHLTSTEQDAAVTAWIAEHTDPATDAPAADPETPPRKHTA